MAGDPQALANRFASLEFFHDLRNAIDQNVLVVDRCQALDAWDDFQPTAIVLVASDLGLGLL